MAGNFRKARQFRSLAKFAGVANEILQGLRNFATLAKLKGLLHLSGVLLVLPFSTLIPIDFFMLELNPNL